jgi:uncharacterized membrane protein YkgB
MSYFLLKISLITEKLNQGFKMNIIFTTRVVSALIFISLSLIGLSFLLGANPNAIKATYSIYNLTHIFSIDSLAKLTGMLMIITAGIVLVSLKYENFKLYAFALLVLISIVPLLTLLSSTRYILAEGGFPVLGTGQGIIKYFSLIALALFLYCRNKITLTNLSWLNFLPIALVLFWIGGLKFMTFEANGIVSLVENSPFMSWLYDVFSVQMASNVIGLFDISAFIILGIAIYNQWKVVAIISGLACASVFIMTQTFLFTTPGSFSPDTLFGGLGQFVIKDLWFIANLVVVTYVNRGWLLGK